MRVVHAVGTVTISNDGATILKLLDIVHPAAKTLVDIARAQDAEVRAPRTLVLQTKTLADSACRLVPRAPFAFSALLPFFFACSLAPRFRFAFVQVGDGTTSVVVFAGELLREAKPFIEESIPTQVIIRGKYGRPPHMPRRPCPPPPCPH